MALRDEINALNNTLSSANRTTQDINNAIERMNELKLDPMITEKDVQLIDRYIASAEGLLRVEERRAKEGKRANREVQAALDGIIGQHKQLNDWITKLIGGNKALAQGFRTTAVASRDLVKSGDFGRFIQQMSAMIPGMKTLGFVVGETMSAYIRIQDQVQIFNRTLIGAQASVGRFTKGMEQAGTISDATLQRIREWGFAVGLTSEQTNELATSLSRAGFRLEEMGLDIQEGEVKGLSEGIDDLASSFGTLSGVLAMARSSGMDTGRVVEQMAYQVKGLGQSTSDVAHTFAMLQVAADRSKLSTQILLPVFRGMQEQFKEMGPASDRVLESLSRVAGAAERAGRGARVGIDAFAGAAGGLANLPLGTQMFLGQQMGTGRGMAAPFAFQLAARDRPGQMLQGVVEQIARMTGRPQLVPLEEAAVDRGAGQARMLQTQAMMKLLGVDQKQAGLLIDVLAQVQRVGAETEKGKQFQQEAAEKLKEMTGGLADYRARTLTAQEKMARFMEVISITLGRVVIDLVRGFAQGFLGVEGGGELGSAFDRVMKAIQTGGGTDEALKEIADATKKFQEAIAGPYAEKLGRSFGESAGKVMKRGDVLGAIGGMAAANPLLAAGISVVALAELKAAFKALTGAAWLGHKAVTGLASGLASPTGLVTASAAAGLAIGTWVRTLKYGEKTIGEWTDSFVSSIFNVQTALDGYAAAQNTYTEQALGNIRRLRQLSGIETGIKARDIMGKADMSVLLEEKGERSATAGLEQAIADLSGKIAESQEQMARHKRVIHAGEDPTAKGHNIFEWWKGVLTSDEEREASATEWRRLRIGVNVMNRELEELKMQRVRLEEAIRAQGLKDGKPEMIPAPRGTTIDTIFQGQGRTSETQTTAPGPNPRMSAAVDLRVNLIDKDTGKKLAEEVVDVALDSGMLSPGLNKGKSWRHGVAKPGYTGGQG